MLLSFAERANPVENIDKTCMLELKVCAVGIWTRVVQTRQGHGRGRLIHTPAISLQYCKQRFEALD